MDYLIELEESDEDLGKSPPFHVNLNSTVNLVTYCTDAKLQKAERLAFVSNGPAFPLRHFTQVCSIHPLSSNRAPRVNENDTGTCP